MTEEKLFEIALNRTLKFEGGYSNDPNDRGGETQFGITHATYRKYCEEFKLPYDSVKNLSEERARKIYKYFYWEKPKFSDLVHIVPDRVLIHVFDGGVNHGVTASTKMLQKSCNLISTEALEPLKVDGVIGQKTMERLSLLSNYPTALESAYVGFRWERYKNINKKEYIKGWLKRLVIIPWII